MLAASATYLTCGNCLRISGVNDVVAIESAKAAILFRKQNMFTIQRLVAAFFICAGAIMSTGAIVITQDGEPEERMQRAQRLTEQGNWKQAAEIYSKLTLDPSFDAEIAARSLAGQALCQMQLNQVDQLDETLKAAVNARPNDWPILQSAAMLLMQTQH